MERLGERVRGALPSDRLRAGRGNIGGALWAAGRSRALMAVGKARIRCALIEPTVCAKMVGGATKGRHALGPVGCTSQDTQR
jgi:hypothetical protein